MAQRCVPAARNFFGTEVNPSLDLQQVLTSVPRAGDAVCAVRDPIDAGSTKARLVAEAGLSSANENGYLFLRTDLTAASALMKP